MVEEIKKHIHCYKCNKVMEELHHFFPQINLCVYCRIIYADLVNQDGTHQSKFIDLKKETKK